MKLTYEIGRCIAEAVLRNHERVVRGCTRRDTAHNIPMKTVAESKASYEELQDGWQLMDIEYERSEMEIAFGRAGLRYLQRLAEILK